MFVVDDEQPICHAFELLLRPHGYLVGAFSSAQSFLDSYCEQWTGCLFTDVQMPDMTGTQLYAELLSRGSRLSVILMTANEGAKSLRDSLGNALILEKPFSGRQLQAVLRQHWPRSCGDGF